MSAVKESFYRQYEQAAIEQQIKYGIPASVTLAQMAIESGSGTSSLSTQYNNYFGIKKGSSWTGQVTYKVDDHTYPEPFRVYGSVAESIEDHSRLLMKPIYQKRCQGLSSTDYIGWATSIGNVYATDGSYAHRLLEEIRTYHLDTIDQKAVLQAQQRGLQIGYMRGTPSSATYQQPQKIQLTPLQGNWALPIDLSKVRVSGDFGENRPGHNHGGLDLSTKGDYLSVHATEDNGKVVSVKPNNGAAGNMITIEYDRLDGTKFQTTYMHLSQIGVKEGDAVTAGQQIGVSGNTGRSTGAHLHFETKFLNQNGEWQKFDPTQYLAELEVRSNQPIQLDKNGQDYLASARSSMEISPSQQGMATQQDPTQALLASITNSNDPTKWLSLLMNNNGETSLGHDRDPISELISSLFSAALTVAMQLRTSEEAQAEAKAEGELKQQSTEEDSTLVKMSRDDVGKLQAYASMQFDSEYPEQTQQTGQRIGYL